MTRFILTVCFVFSVCLPAQAESTVESTAAHVAQSVVPGQPVAAGAETPSPGVPDAFESGDWTLTDTEEGGTLEVVIVSLPDNGGSAITDIEYKVDAGDWTSSGGTVTFDITGLTDDVEVDVQIRAVNAIGEGDASDTKSATPTTASASEYLDSVIASAVADLDATIEASYGGTGQTWANLIASPADGASQTDYDFYLGATGDASTNDPTFTGTAGDAGAYFALDGGDYFDLKAASNPPTFRDAHKTTGGSDFWLAMVVYAPPADSGSEGFFSTRQSSAYIGVALNQNGSEALGISQRGDTNVTAANSAGGTVVPEDWNIIIFSRGHSEGKNRFWANSATALAEGSHTWNATETDASGIATLCRHYRSGSTLPLDNGARIVHFSAGNEFLTDEKVAAIIAHLEARHGRDYTP